MKRFTLHPGAFAHIITLAVMAVALSVAAYSFARAEWVRDSLRYANAVWLGGLCGAALAASRFRGRFGVIYSLSLALAAAGEAAGQVLPALPVLFQGPAPVVIWGMHVRALTLFDRINGWLQAIQGGLTLRDTGLFVFLMVVVLWQAGAWLAWQAMRRKWALAGVLPLGLLLGLSNHLSRRPDSEFGVFLACAVALIAHTAFTGSRAEWERRGLDYPDSITIDWGASNVQLTVVIGALVLAAPLFGTPAGWRILGEVFRSAQAQTADTASRLFAGVNPPRIESNAVSARTPDLGRIGSPLPQGQDTVMWVTVDDPAPPPPEAGIPQTNVPRHYWRSKISATYTGTGWDPLLLPANGGAAGPSGSQEAEPPAGRYALWQRFEIVAAHGDDLFAVNAPVTATTSEAGSAAVTLYPLDADGDALVRGALAAYEVTSWATDVRASQLAAASKAYPADIQAIYLQLPVALPQRVRDLAARIENGAATPYDMAIRIQDYLRANYHYQLDVPPAPPGQDAVDYFLFDAPGGYCSYYASAMAVLLRAEGVPARVAVGFAMGEYDFQRRAYRVPADSAHAWVEVFFPGYGWVEFEPTAAQAPFDYGLETGAASPPPAAASAPSNPSRGAGWLLGLGLAGLLAALGVFVWWRRRRRVGLNPVNALYWRVRAALARAGLSAPSSTTPDEFLATCSPALDERPALRAAVTIVTRLYVQASYSPHPARVSDTWAANQMWQEARPEWLRLWWRTAWHRRRNNTKASKKSAR